MASLQMAGRVQVMADAVRAAGYLSVIGLAPRASILSLLIVSFFVGSDIVPDLLVLLEEKPEHTVKLLGRLDLHLGV